MRQTTKQRRRYRIPYVPHSAQEPFHNDRYKVKFRLIRAATGSGKTKAGVFEDFSWVFENPGCVGYIYEPTLKMVRKILVPTLDDLLGKPFWNNRIIHEYNKSDQRIEIATDPLSTIWLSGLEDPEMAEGPNIDFGHIDEARLIRHFATAWLVVQRRTRGSVPGKYPTGAWITTTPDAPGSDLDQFFDNEKTKDPQAQSYVMTLDDNIHLTPDYIDRIKRTHHGGLAKRFVWGEYAAVGAGIVPFDYDMHVISLAEFNRAIIKQMVYAIDFGWDNPSCVLAIAFDSDKRPWVIDEYYQSRITLDQLLEEAKAMRERWGEGTFYCDPSAKQTIEWLKSKGLDAEKSEPGRDESIKFMAGYFPRRKDDGKPGIFILRTCVNLIAELQVYEGKKEFDHAVDPLRYGLGSKMGLHGDVDAWILG